MSLRMRDRLKHILVETKYLTELSSRVNNQEDLVNNEDLKRSTERSIEIIGEAVKALPEEIRQLSPDTQWSNIARMRDNVIHRYHDVNYNIVWQVIKEYAPSLNREIAKILDKLNRQEYYRYRSQIDTEQIVSSDRLETDYLEQVDIAIASTILNEYPTKFRKVAIAEIRDIISVGDKATSLLTASENMSADKYISQIISKIETKSFDKNNNDA